MSDNLVLLPIQIVEIDSIGYMDKKEKNSEKQERGGKDPIFIITQA